MRTTTLARLLILVLGLAFQYSVHAQPASVLTYNIRYDNPGDGDNSWENRKERLAEQVMGMMPDIVGIQEGLLNQLTFLDSTWTNYSYVGVGREDGRMRGEYCAIFYRNDMFSVDTSGTFWLSTTPDQVSKGWDAALPRICTFACLRDTFTNLRTWVFNTHFDHLGDTARLKSAELIIRKMNELHRREEFLVLMGDFNCTVNDAPIKVILQSLNNTQDLALMKGPNTLGTFNGFKPSASIENPKTIDFIFVDPEHFDVLEYRVLVTNNAQDGHFPSDHFPVRVSFDSYY